MRLGGAVSDARHGFHARAVAAAAVLATLERLGEEILPLGAGLVPPNKVKGLATSCSGRREGQSPQGTIEKETASRAARRHRATAAVEDAGYRAAAAAAAEALATQSGTGE